MPVNMRFPRDVLAAADALAELESREGPRVTRTDLFERAVRRELDRAELEREMALTPASRERSEGRSGSSPRGPVTGRSEETPAARGASSSPEGEAAARAAKRARQERLNRQKDVSS